MLHSFQIKTVHKLCIESERVFMLFIMMQAVTVIAALLRKHIPAPILYGKSLCNFNQTLALWMKGYCQKFIETIPKFYRKF
jgi:hypothetical protein